VHRLHQHTGGNPRLAELVGALYEAGAADSIGAVVLQLPHFQAVLPIWVRLEQRLPLAEREVLRLLAVFRSPAPADVWLEGMPEEAAALTQLIGRRLVQEDGQGGVALLPALREVVYGEMTKEAQEGYHLRAAQIRAERGEYTPAAYHLFRAG